MPYTRPQWGGTIKLQQKAPERTNILINKSNIKSVTKQCNYTSMNSNGFYGYVSIDDNNNAYFTDFSGYVTSIDLETCNERWRTKISEALGYNSSLINYISRNGLSLFQNSKGEKGVLIGTPNAPTGALGFIQHYAFALYQNNGSLMWKLELGNSSWEV